MTYPAYEYSTQSGMPVFRFLFIYADTEYRYTTESSFTSNSSGTYEPAPIKTGDFNQTNEMAKDDLKLEFPRDNDFAQLFLGGVPEQVVSVTVFRGHRNDPDGEFRFYWKGRVAGASIDGDTVTIECESIFTSMRRPGLRARYQKTCRHALYQTGCNLSKSDYAYVVSATAIDGDVVTVSDLSTSSNYTGTYFVGGMIEYDGVYRYVESHTDTALTLLQSFRDLSNAIDSSGPVDITLYPGCDHTRGTCVNKFDNVLNFGGFPWIPSKNPFGNDVTGSIA